MIKYKSKIYQVVCWTTSVAMVGYLITVLLTVRHISPTMINSLLANNLQRLNWLSLRSIAPHLISASYWIPYWCAIILMFVYRERVRFMFWLNRFMIFGALLTILLFSLNLISRTLRPDLCGRSANFLHPQPYENCQLFYVCGSVVTGMFLLSLFCLRKRLWMVKVMLGINSVILIITALSQGFYFPLQLLAAVGVATIAAVFAFIKISLASQERFPELYNYLK